MAATMNTINRRNPRERFTLQADPLGLFWDSTNHRFKSGYLAVNVTGVTWTYGAGGTERIAVKVSPPNYSPAHNVKSEADYLVSAGTVGAINQTHNVAVNYGSVDPSAVVQGDGTADLLYVDVECVNDDLTAIDNLVVSVTGTVTFTAIDVYNTLAGGLSYTMNLGVDQYRPADFGVIAATPSTFSTLNALAVQLQTLGTTLTDHRRADFPPELSVALAAENPAYRYGLVGGPVAKASTGSRTFKEAFSWVYAVNNSNCPDACASRMQVGASSYYAMMNVALAKRAGDDEATAALAYKLVGY